MFYDRLKKVCDEKNTNMTALSKQLKFSSGNISKWKNGGIPKSETLILIAKELSISTDYLLGLDNVPDRKKQSPELSEDTQRLIEMYTKLNDMEKGEILGELKIIIKNKLITVSTAARDNAKPSTENISQSEIDDFKNVKSQKY